MLYWYYRYKTVPNLDYRSLPLVPVSSFICGCLNKIRNRIINNEIAQFDDLGESVILIEENLKIAIETGLLSKVTNAESNIKALKDQPASIWRKRLLWIMDKF